MLKITILQREDNESIVWDVTIKKDGTFVENFVSETLVDALLSSADFLDDNGMTPDQVVFSCK